MDSTVRDSARNVSLDTPQEICAIMIDATRGSRNRRGPSNGLALGRKPWSGDFPAASASPDEGLFYVCSPSRTPNDMKCCSAAREKRAAPTLASQRESALVQGSTRTGQARMKRLAPDRAPGNRMSLQSGHRTGSFRWWLAYA